MKTFFEQAALGHARECSALMLEHAASALTFDQKLYMLYVINDVVHQAKRKVDAGMATADVTEKEEGAVGLEILHAVEDHLPLILRGVLTTDGATDAQKDRVFKVVKLWVARAIYEQTTIDRI